MLSSRGFAFFCVGMFYRNQRCIGDGGSIIIFLKATTKQFWQMQPTRKYDNKVNWIVIIYSHPQTSLSIHHASLTYSTHDWMCSCIITKHARARPPHSLYIVSIGVVHSCSIWSSQRVCCGILWSCYYWCMNAKIAFHQFAVTLCNGVYWQACNPLSGHFVQIAQCKSIDSHPILLLSQICG